MKEQRVIVGVDPGASVSGVCAWDGVGVLYAGNLPNIEVFGKVRELAGGREIAAGIEDIRPYKGMRCNLNMVDTCKFIGELSYRLNCCPFVGALSLVARNSVKKWIFDCCPAVCLPRIAKRMQVVNDRRVLAGLPGLVRSDGAMRSPSFHYVDDRIVIAALKVMLDIPTPKPGRPNVYGLVSHSWQALGVAAYLNYLT